MKGLGWLAVPLVLAGQPRLPDYTRQVLPNGTVLLLMAKKDVPMITLRAVVRGGAEADPAELAGLGAITAELLRRGTATRSADQFSEELDFIGATFSAQVDQQAATVSSEFLGKDLDRALDLLSDALLRPAFAAEEVKKVLAERVDAARAVKDNPSFANFFYLRPFLFPPRHPYSRQPGGDEISLKRIERQQIVEHHKGLYCGRNLIVIAAGDLDVGVAGPKLAKAFGPAPASTAYTWAKDAPPLARNAARLLLVDKPDATQTYFLIAWPGVHRKHPDRVALRLVNTLFGGRFTSMLNDELRVNSGLTYGAGSRLELNRLPGAIAISSYTRTETTAKAIDLALDVLKRLRDKGITAEQLASAKAYIKGTFPADQLETADQLAAILAELELFELDRGEIDGLFAQIDAVTVEQANAVARKHYQAENLQFCLLGNAAKIREEVAKYARKVVEVSINAPGFGAGE